MKARRPRTLAALFLCMGATLFPPIPADAQLGTTQPRAQGGGGDKRPPRQQLVIGKCSKTWKGPTNASCAAGEYHPAPLPPMSPSRGTLGGEGDRSIMNEYRWICNNTSGGFDSLVPGLSARGQETLGGVVCIAPRGNTRQQGMDTIFTAQINECKRNFDNLRQAKRAYDQATGGGNGCRHQQLCEDYAQKVVKAMGSGEQASPAFNNACGNLDRCRAANLHGRTRNYIRALLSYNTMCGFIVSAD